QRRLAALTAEPPRGACPACGEPLRQRTGAAGRGCAACGGRFLTRAELAAWLASIERRVTPDGLKGERAECERRKRAAAAAPVRYLRCPACAGRMDRKAFAKVSGIVVQQCAEGTFLSASDAEQIESFVRHGGEQIAAQA